MKPTHAHGWVRVNLQPGDLLIVLQELLRDPTVAEVLDFNAQRGGANVTDMPSTVTKWTDKFHDAGLGVDDILNKYVRPVPASLRNNEAYNLKGSITRDRVGLPVHDIPQWMSGGHHRMDRSKLAEETTSTPLDRAEALDLYRSIIVDGGPNVCFDGIVDVRLALNLFVRLFNWVI
jgi:hypothetical protein